MCLFAFLSLRLTSVLKEIHQKISHAVFQAKFSIEINIRRAYWLKIDYISVQYLWEDKYLSGIFLRPRGSSAGPLEMLLQKQQAVTSLCYQPVTQDRSKHSGDPGNELMISKATNNLTKTFSNSDDEKGFTSSLWKCLCHLHFPSLPRGNLFRQN